MDAAAPLPYPHGITIDVYRDDGRWDDYSAWFMRTDADLKELAVVRITLAHYEDDEPEPAYTYAQWKRKAAEILAEYPGCIFIY